MGKSTSSKSRGKATGRSRQYVSKRYVRSRGSMEKRRPDIGIPHWSSQVSTFGIQPNGYATSRSCVHLHETVSSRTRGSSGTRFAVSTSFMHYGGCLRFDNEQAACPCQTCTRTPITSSPRLTHRSLQATPRAPLDTAPNRLHALRLLRSARLGRWQPRHRRRCVERVP